MKNLTDEEMADFEEELEDTSVKALLIQQNAYLYQIATILGSTQSQQDTSDAMVTCSMCNESYPENEVVEHAIEEHNAPSDISIESVANL